MNRATYCIVAATLAMLQLCGCSGNNDIVPSEEEVQVPIAFAIGNDADSRALSTYYVAGSTLAEGSAVGIFGYYQGTADWSTWNGNNKTANVFYNEKFLSDGNKNLSYANSTHTRYWPMTDGEKCSFFAYYPFVDTDQTSNGITIDKTKIGTGANMGSIAFVTNPKAEEQVDLLVSDFVPDMTRLEDNRRVHLLFHHALAQIRIVPGSNFNEDEIDEITMDGIKLNGTLSPTYAGGATSLNWGDLSNSGNVVIDYKKTESERYLLLIPQSFSSLEFSVRTGGVVQTATFDDGGTWAPNTVYTYNLSDGIGIVTIPIEGIRIWDKDVDTETKVKRVKDETMNFPDNLKPGDVISFYYYTETTGFFQLQLSNAYNNNAVFDSDSQLVFSNTEGVNGEGGGYTNNDYTRQVYSITLTQEMIDRILPKNKGAGQNTSEYCMQFTPSGIVVEAITITPYDGRSLADPPKEHVDSFDVEVWNTSSGNNTVSRVTLTDPAIEIPDDLEVGDKLVFNFECTDQYYCAFQLTGSNYIGQYPVTGQTQYTLTLTDAILSNIQSSTGDTWLSFTTDRLNMNSIKVKRGD